MHGATYAKPCWLLLLPLFFVFHGYTAHYESVTAADALWLCVFYAGVMLLLSLVFLPFYKNGHKALLAAFGVLCVQFFFGALQDFLRARILTSWLGRYSLLVPVLSILLLTWLLWLRRTRLTFIRLTAYLNLVLFLWMALDAGLFLGRLKPEKTKTVADLLPLKTPGRPPDVYLVILDEYTGSNTLKEVFGFDNGLFEKGLWDRGFHIMKNSRSNYNYTPYSIASLLQMNYLKLNFATRNPGNIDACYEWIRNSPVIASMVHSGYHFYNYSIFDIQHQPAFMRDGFLPYGSEWITRQTFTSRLQRDIRFDLATGQMNWITGLKKITYEHLTNNQFILEQAPKAGQEDLQPKLVYLHLMLPHYPYFFDHNGRPYPFASLVNGGERNRQHYIEYLQYGNRKILELIDQIRKAHKQPPIMLIMGDHGFRHFDRPRDHQYYFSNFSAVYLPTADYRAFYDAITPVNTFRALFNSTYGTQLPMLKDSSIYLWE